MLISYAQNFEDLVLDRVFHGQDRGFYIDVGAGHPVNDSVTQLFYARGWRGINLEPDQRLFQHFAAARPRDVNLDIAAGEQAETRTFFAFEVLGHSSLDAARAAEVGGRGRPAVKSSVVVETLAEVCRRHAEAPIDFLKIDAEGWERPVLAGHDWQRFRPKVVVVEATKPETSIANHEAWEPLLLAQGYVFAVFDGLNRFYADAAHGEFVPVLAAPPRFLADGAVLYREIEAQQREVEARQNAEAAQARAGALEGQAAELGRMCRAAQADAAEAARRAEEARASAAAAMQLANAAQAQTDAAQRHASDAQARADAAQVRADAAIRRGDSEQERAETATKRADAEKTRANMEKARADAAEKAYTDWATSSIGRFAHTLHLHRRRKV